jgi:CubicO group peptidase (beta-lactamase class C family)
MTQRKRTLLISLAFFLIALFLAQPPNPANAQDLPDLERFMGELIQAQMDAHHIPNAAVAVVSGGEVLYLKGFGQVNLETGHPVDPETTLFRIGSTAKLVTWTAVMQLVEQGLLDLDADVNQYLDFQIPSTVLSQPGEVAPVTLAHLMTHTAGFEAYPDQIFRLSPENLLPLDQYVRQHLPVRAFPPGEVAAYSNYGTALAGYIVERVSGQPFASYTEANIFAPLGMKHSTFRQPVSAELAGNIAHPYRYVDGAYRPADFEFMQEPEGSLSSTAADMARFMLAHLGDGSLEGGRVLREDTLHRMHTPQPARHPDLGGMTLGFMHGKFNDLNVLFHGGSTLLFDTGLYLLPEVDTGLFITYSGANHLVHTTLFQSFLQRYYPSSSSTAPAPSEGMAERSARFSGEYHQNTRSFTTEESFNSLNMGIIQVDVDTEGYLLVTHLGETDSFVELEPGLYRNLRQGRTQDYFGPFRTLVFETDPFGQTLLASDGPMTYSQAPWYGSSVFTLPALVLILLLMLVSLIIWGIGSALSGIRQRRSVEPARSPKTVRGAAAARWVGAIFALMAILFLLSVVLSGASDPVYQLPPAAFGISPAWIGLVDLLPWLLIPLGTALVVFTVLAWRNRYWRAPARVHYSIITAAALLLISILNYWNVY